MLKHNVANIRLYIGNKYRLHVRRHKYLLLGSKYFLLVRKTCYLHVRLYVGNVHRLLVRFNKYLFIHSKYLYLGTRKVFKLPKISTKELIEELPNIRLYDGIVDLTDELFEEQMELVVNLVDIGGKVVDLRHLPKGCMILRQGESNDTEE